jgi:DNA repair protein RecO (recombination protein O)
VSGRLAIGRTVRSEAIVLRSVDFGEADRIVTLLTKDLGKIAVIARNARKSQKRFGGALEPFAVMAAEVALGRGEVSRLASAALIRPFPSILGTLAKMQAGGRALELVRDAIPNGPVDARIFDVCVGVFAMLDGAETVREEHELAFVVRLASLLGFAPRVDRCVQCGAVAPPGKAALFDAQRSAIACRACGGAPIKLSGATRRILGALGTAGWKDLAHAPWPSAARDEVRRVADGLVVSHLVRS